MLTRWGALLRGGGSPKPSPVLMGVAALQRGVVGPKAESGSTPGNGPVQRGRVEGSMIRTHGEGCCCAERQAWPWACMAAARAPGRAGGRGRQVTRGQAAAPDGPVPSVASAGTILRGSLS